MNDGAFNHDLHDRRRLRSNGSTSEEKRHQALDEGSGLPRRTDERCGRAVRWRAARRRRSPAVGLQVQASDRRASAPTAPERLCGTCAASICRPELVSRSEGHKARYCAQLGVLEYCIPECATVATCLSCWYPGRVLMADKLPRRARPRSNATVGRDRRCGADGSVFALDRDRRQRSGRYRLGSRKDRRPASLPFYVGLMILGIEHRQFRHGRSRSRSDRSSFAEWGQLAQVMSMLVPTAIYVALGADDRDLRRLALLLIAGLHAMARHATAGAMVAAIALGVLDRRLFILREVVPPAFAARADRGVSGYYCTAFHGEPAARIRTCQSETADAGRASCE